MKINKQALEKELAKNCLSLKELRLLASLSLSTISKVRNGKDYEATPKTIGKLSRALGCGVETIIREENNNVI
jgi:DNA-binding Xre family transcriptional regulator